jgi:hypothetical protein
VRAKKQKEENNLDISYNIKIELSLNGFFKIESRVRYNIWDLLGDVGGFNDGLFLLCSIFIAPLSSMAFTNDFLNDQTIDATKKGRLRHF